MNDKVIILIALVVGAWVLLSDDKKRERKVLITPPPPPLPPARNPSSTDKGRETAVKACEFSGNLLTAGIIGRSQCDSIADFGIKISEPIGRAIDRSKAGRFAMEVVSTPIDIFSQGPGGQLKDIGRAGATLLGFGGRAHRLQDSELRKLRNRCMTNTSVSINDLAFKENGKGFTFDKIQDNRCFKTLKDLTDQCQRKDRPARSFRDIVFCNQIGEKPYLKRDSKLAKEIKNSSDVAKLI